ncbi:ferritin-like domain-containing protein [Alkaliphilus serpentinus]|uniref:Ferritin family protein n=1 Tax=Alkaliphilus serpentinus TaxID=1482731 RepID=A0A833M898_9FIRM|nr:ferritin family protein [Alkaliphilus serpentinus]KAB3524438.1 ferritin family protein [Alkaliphilus serpentinus]
MNYLDFAIKMELEGEKYYKEQAEKNKDNRLHTIFTFLAKDEKAHAEILRNKAAELPYDLEDDNALSEYKNVFQSEEDFNLNIKAKPQQIDAYRMALEKEKESIELYENMLSQSQDPISTELFKYLIEQEKSHYQIFENLVAHLLKAKEWVEAAEFNIKKTY